MLKCNAVKMFIFSQKFPQASSQPQHHSDAFWNHLFVFVMPRGWGVHFLLRADQRHLRWKIGISGLGKNHCHDQSPPCSHELLAQLCHLLQGKQQGIDNKQWLLYIWTSVWVLRTPNTGWNMLFNVSWAKKLKKERNRCGVSMTEGVHAYPLCHCIHESLFWAF